MCCGYQRVDMLQQLLAPPPTGSAAPLHPCTPPALRATHTFAAACTTPTPLTLHYTSSGPYGSVDGGCVDGESVDSGCVDCDRVDRGCVDHGPVDSGSVDDESVDCRCVDSGCVDDSSVDHGCVDDEPVDDEPVDDEPVDDRPVDDLCIGQFDRWQLSLSLSWWMVECMGWPVQRREEKMDITPLFKACIKSVRTRNKTLGAATGSASPASPDDKRRILHTRKTKPNAGFESVAREVTGQISRVREFLLEHRAGYLSCLDAVRGDEWSDAERERLDVGAQRALNTCATLVRDLRNGNHQAKVTPQIREYMNAVVDLIDAYLKSVCKIHSELKALRVKRALDVRKLARLEIQHKPASISTSALGPVADKDAGTEIVNDIDATDEAIVKPDVVGITRSTDLTESEAAILSDEDQLSAEELQMFESENHQLYNELNNLSEEVKQIESKVLHIAELQEIFTEKILQQEQDIDRIANTVVGATENVKDANDQIRQAIQRNAGLRVYVLFFLLVMSFTLLFLDWYND